MIPNRVFFNSKTGEILFQTGEILKGGVPRDDNETIDWIDVPIGALDYMSEYVSRVDITTKELTVEKYPLTNEQIIKELEDQLLLQTENEVGGIL